MSDVIGKMSNKDIAELLDVDGYRTGYMMVGHDEYEYDEVLIGQEWMEVSIDWREIRRDVKIDELLKK